MHDYSGIKCPRFFNFAIEIRNERAEGNCIRTWSKFPTTWPPASMNEKPSNQGRDGGPNGRRKSALILGLDDAIFGLSYPLLFCSPACTFASSRPDQKKRQACVSHGPYRSRPTLNAPPLAARASWRTASLGFSLRQVLLELALNRDLLLLVEQK